ncbi:MAG: hypothetical protein ACJ77A_03360 [Actinomycetota bacterium]
MERFVSKLDAPRPGGSAVAVTEAVVEALGGNVRVRVTGSIEHQSLNLSVKRVTADARSFRLSELPASSGGPDVGKKGPVPYRWIRHRSAPAGAGGRRKQ